MLREIRVKPVVRYLLTDFIAIGDKRTHEPLGEFSSASAANRIGAALAYQARLQAGATVVYEPARTLRIDAVRGPGQPHPAVRWELREVTSA